MPTFERGDIVRVDYASPKLIEEWMSGERAVGPGDVGQVKFTPSEGPQLITADRFGVITNHWSGTVTVEFPMLGTFGVHSSNLKLVQKAEKLAIDVRADL